MPNQLLTFDDTASDTDLAAVANSVRAYVAASRAPGTILAYRSAWASFETWCTARCVAALPATPAIVAAYLAAQAADLRPVTLGKHAAAIAAAHKAAGFPNPCREELVRLTLTGIRRTHGLQAKPKAALRLHHLRALLASCGDDELGVRDRAMLLIGYAAGMRRSELVGLDLADLRFEPEGAVVTIRRSKRDQEGRGREVGIPRGRHEATCPVRQLQAWLATRGEHAGPVFVRLDRGRTGSEQRLSGQAVAQTIHRLASSAGLDPAAFAGHSLRRGFATEAARAGAAEADIARTTGHKSLVVLRRYVEAGTVFHRNAAGVLDL